MRERKQREIPPEWITVERFRDPSQKSIKTLHWAKACPGYRVMSDVDPDPKFKGYYRILIWDIPERKGPNIIRKINRG
jgi:hypothetical protein